MPPRLDRLLALAERPTRRVLGLMSGTSGDGLDCALCAFTGHGADTRVQVEHFRTLPYTPEERARLQGVISRPRVDLHALTTLHAWLAARHAAMVQEALQGWEVAPGAVDLLASHGMTAFHAPAGWTEGEALRHATLQIGDGDLLAVRTGLLTLSDFRQKEIAAGGEGAPLAPYGERLLFSGPVPRVLINLGGIANFTWLPARGSGAPVLCGDTGPANGLVDRAVRHCRPDDADGFDRDGRMAAAGRIHAGLLSRLLAHPYFARPFPKSTGPELFGDAYLGDVWREASALGLSDADLVATLTRLTVETVAAALRTTGAADAGTEAYVSGGGRHNPVLMAGLRDTLPGLAWREVEQLGLPADAKEAVLFAALAHESLFGEGFAPLTGPADGRRFGFGKLSWPD